MSPALQCKEEFTVCAAETAAEQLQRWSDLPKAVLRTLWQRQELWLCPFQTANTEAWTGQSGWMCCFSSLAPLQGSVCRKGPVWSQSSSALGCVATLQHHSSILPLCLLSSGNCRDARTSSQAFRYLKSQRALVHPIKECQVIPLCS